MGLSIHLLGSPRIERDGAPVEAPRGHKPWGLLTYLLRSRLPPSPERLASLLFPRPTTRWERSAGRSPPSAAGWVTTPRSAGILFD